MHSPGSRDPLQASNFNFEIFLTRSLKRVACDRFTNLPLGQITNIPLEQRLLRFRTAVCHDCVSRLSRQCALTVCSVSRQCVTTVCSVSRRLSCQTQVKTKMPVDQVNTPPTNTLGQTTLQQCFNARRPFSCNICIEIIFS